ncbi:MAG: serine/threonine-protein kinase [Isosphaeraceae bacterium]
MSLEAGVRIGDFEIEGRLGAGGMGVVYRARQVSHNRVVALKILGEALDTAEGRQRFRREAQAIARLDHPSIASVYFVGQNDELCCLAMEYIDGAPLRKVLDRLSVATGPEVSIESVVNEVSVTGRGSNSPGDFERFDLPTENHPEPTDVLTVAPASGGSAAGSASPVAPGGPTRLRPEVLKRLGSAEYVRRCCELAREAALALEHAHRRGVIHRDVKPANLMVDRSGKVHVVDFGLARYVEDLTITQSGALVGTPMYMSPEQVTGRLELDDRTDVYSLGLVLYEMLTLRRPIEAPTREAILRQVVTKPRPPLRGKNPAVSTDLERVIHRAVALDPDARYPTAQAFADDLSRVLEGRPVEAPAFRYAPDETELLAARPLGVAVLSYLLSTVWGLSLLFVVALCYLVYQDWAMKPYSWTTLTGLTLCVVGFGALIAGSLGLLSGRRWARRVVATFSILLILWFVPVCADMLARREPEAAGLVFIPGFSALTLWMLRRPSLRAWFARVDEARQQERGEFSAG